MFEKKEDNLKLEGRIEIPDKPKFEPVQRPKPIKVVDNLRMEGEFVDMKRVEKKVIKGERAEVVKHATNLKMTGDFNATTTSKSEFVSQTVASERPKLIKQSDNLKLEGEFIDIRKTEQKVVKGERAEIVKHDNNLKMSGKFTGISMSKSQFVSQTIDRVSPKKPVDNLKPEGDFDKPLKHVYQPVERAQLIRQSDNLKIEGEFIDIKKTEQRVMKGERAAIVRHDTNLKMSGDFIGMFNII